MGGRPSNYRFCVAASLLCLGSIAAPAPSALADPAPPPVRVFQSPFGVSVTASDLDDRVIVDFQAPNFVISSPSGVTGCVTESSTKARCTRYGTIGISLGAGEDRIALKSSGVHGDVRAGLGSDVLNGSRASNALRGGHGDDLLRGYKGRDILDGGKGVDRLIGGAQDDRIYADDHRRDDRIDCGAGKHDLAVIDKRDPKPIGCERVRFR